MVSFSCEVCNDTVQKKKLDQHKQRCHGAYFTCIDCSTTFGNTDYRNHTSCISEAEKYEKGLYKGNKKNKQQQQQQAKPAESVKPVKETPAEVTKSDKKSAKKDKTTKDLSSYIKGETSLYKVLKQVAKDSKKDKKDVLKKLQLSKSASGEIVITL